jgi:uncharacterized protein
MEKTITHDERYQQFSITLGNDEAELAYATPMDKVIDFTHTYVPEAYRDQGFAAKLITFGLNYAETNELKVIATCGVVKDFILQNPKYKFLLLKL